MKIRKKIHITALFAVLFLFVLVGHDSTAEEVTEPNPNIPPAATILTIEAGTETTYDEKDDPRHNTPIKSYTLKVTFKKGTIVAKNPTFTPEDIRYSVAYAKKNLSTDTPRSATALMTAVVKKIANAKVKAKAKVKDDRSTYVKRFYNPRYDRSYILQELLISLPVPSDPSTEVTIGGLEKNTDYEMIILASATSKNVVYTVPSEVTTKKTLSQ